MNEVVSPPRPAPVVHIPDYDNFQYATQDAPEYIEHIKSVLAKANEKVNSRTGFPEKNAFGHRHAAPSVIGTASEEALTYLSEIRSECLMQLIQDQTLEVFQGEKKAGSYSIKISRIPADAGKEFFHVTTHMTSQVGGERVNEMHDGVVSENMATVYEKYSRSESNGKTASERKYQYEHQPDGMCSVSILNSDNGEVSSWLNVYPEDQVKGFVSEIAHVLLVRLFAMEENVPDNFVVLMLNNFGHFQEVTYNSILPRKTFTFRPYKVNSFGLSRKVPRGSDQAHARVDEHFLNRRLINSAEENSEITVRATEIPPWDSSNFTQPTDLQGSTSNEADDSWLLKFRKAESKVTCDKQYANTMAKYPQLLQPLQEMVQLVLAVRPDDVFQFVNDSFRNYKTLFSKSTHENKNKVLAHITRDNYEQDEPQDRAFQLLRSYGLDK